MLVSVIARTTASSNASSRRRGEKVVEVLILVVLTCSTPLGDDEEVCDSQSRRIGIAREEDENVWVLIVLVSGCVFVCSTSFIILLQEAW